MARNVKAVSDSLAKLRSATQGAARDTTAQKPKKDWLKDLQSKFKRRGPEPEPRMNQAVVDTAGMDEEMKKTLREMRGPVGSAKPKKER